MAITNHDRVGKAMEWLREGLAPFVERELNDKVRTSGCWFPGRSDRMPPSPGRRSV